MPQAPNKELYSFPTARRKGVIATVIFHVILAVILIISGFHTPSPPPEEEGILINFGSDDTGSGLFEPPASSSPEEAVAEEILEESTQEQIAEPQADESLMTQDFEEAPVIQKTIEQADPEKERLKKEAVEAEKLRQQQIEEERIRKEAEEAERKKIEEEQRRRTEIMNRTRDALDRANAAGNNANLSEGIAGGEGNQGVENGSVDSNNYGEGSGTGTKGVSYDLAGRQARSLPIPTYDIQSEGVVVVEVTVDRNGNVTKAIPGVKGSTTLEEYFLRVASKAALAAKFDRKPDAPVIQKGSITYHFILR